METRPDTSSSSSGRFQGQWSFLANPPQYAQPRSLPPSSYIPHSDRSSVLPLPTGLHYQAAADGSRSSLPRNLTTSSIRGRTNATIPSQPVLLRVHSADASAHTNPAPRPRRPINMNKHNGLPAISEFSIQGILAAIQEDVESDINTIAEILGRSRLVLADQHDSHMPPQGEIRAMPNSLQAVEEASSSSERLAVDNVMILREDASLIDGSHVGSAAYDLLERLQAVPRPNRIGGGVQASPFPGSPTRNNSSPAALHSDGTDHEYRQQHGAQRRSRRLLQMSSSPTNASRTTGAVVSESHLSAGANGIDNNDMLLTSEPAHLLPFYEAEDLDGIEHRSASSDADHPRTLRERMQNLLYVSDPTGLSTWLQGQSTEPENHHHRNAESQLREILER